MRLTYRTLHPKATEYTSFSSTHEAFSRIGNMLGQKTSLNKGNKAEMILSVFSNHNGIKLEIRNMGLPWWSSG